MLIHDRVRSILAVEPGSGAEGQENRPKFRRDRVASCRLRPVGARTARRPSKQRFWPVDQIAQLLNHPVTRNCVPLAAPLRRRESRRCIGSLLSVKRGKCLQLRAAQSPALTCSGQCA